MEVKILGGGCPRCKRLEALARRVAAEVGVEASFAKVTDIADIMAYDVASTPALVIGGRVVAEGRVPGEDEIAGWMREATASG